MQIQDWRGKPIVEGNPAVPDLCDALDTLVAAHWVLTSISDGLMRLPRTLSEQIRNADDELLRAIMALKAIIQERGLAL